MNKEKENSNLKLKQNAKLLILAFLIISIFFINEDNLETLFSLGKNERQIDLIASIEVPEASNINIYEDNISVWTQNKLSIFDLKGNLKTEKEFEFEDSSVHFGKNYIYIADKTSGDVHKLNTDGETINLLNFKNPFFNIYEKNGNTLYHTKSNESESIYIYNKNDVLVAERSFIGKNVLSYEIENADTDYTISTLDLNKNNLKSKLTTYDKKSEEKFSLDIDKEIVLYMDTLNSTNMAVLTDKSLYSIKDEQIIWEKSFNLIKDMYIEDKIYILYSNYLESINFEGKTIENIGFDKNYQNIIPIGKDILAYGEDGFSLISNDKEVLQHVSNIDHLSTFGENIVILNDGKLYVYRVVKI